MMSEADCRMVVSGVEIIPKRDTSSMWKRNNPVLGKDEIGFDLNARMFKRGDGKTHWNDLDWWAMILTRR